MKADEVFGPTYVHVRYWYCVVHHGVADDTDEVCDRMPLRPWLQTPCHLFQLGYSDARIDGPGGEA